MSYKQQDKNNEQHSEKMLTNEEFQEKCECLGIQVERLLICSGIKLR